MFTGLIEEIGTVIRMEMSHSAGTLTIAAGFPTDEITIGDSIAVNGVCLTVTGKASGIYSFDVSPETVERSSLKEFKKGSPVNLERALPVSGRLDGHFVSGHVDCVAVIGERHMISGNTTLGFLVPKEFMRYVAAKGSVAIDGISLTVNTLNDKGFSVNMIPHTLTKTNLRDKKVGDQVNIETDILAKYVERLLVGKERVNSTGVTVDLLAKNGFV